MAKRSEIIKYLNKFLKIDQIPDSSFNGLQFEGKSEVKTIAFAVTAGTKAYEMAAKQNADMIIVHHGQYWKSMNPNVVSMNKKRLDLLYGYDMSLYAVHLPLDKHETVGNNAQLIKISGAIKSNEFGLHNGMYIGYTGKFNKAVSLDSLVKKLNKKLDTECMVLPFGKSKIKTIGVISGGVGISEMHQAVEAGLDAYITGEQCELYNDAFDSEINVIFAGHHATERVGLKALMPILAKKFKVKTFFADVPSGL